MTSKKLILLITLLITGFFFIFAQSSGTSNNDSLKTGIALYGEGKFNEAADILQRLGPVPEALYWASLSELSAGNYNKSLAHLETLETVDPNGRWGMEIPYHRGRCFFYLGRQEEALASFTAFSNKISDSDSRKASSLYWQGESLYALGRLDDASGAFSAVIKNYPRSAKYEAAFYRLNLINQKKIEAELLGILKWSHEESLKSLEEYQEREKNYEAAIAAYSERINELIAISGEESAMAGNYQDSLTMADRRIATLEASLAEANALLIELGDSGIQGVPSRQYTDTERSLRILELKTAVLELINSLNKKLNEEN